MSNKKFTEVEINHLQANSYVLEATPNTVHFSAEFKKKFWDALSEGATPRETVASMGIDPDVLGSSRLSGLKDMIRNCELNRRIRKTLRTGGVRGVKA